jgi:DUF4097 and DUF4098 domain-containing protein YvlB
MRLRSCLVTAALTVLTAGVASVNGQQGDRGVASSATARAIPSAYQGRRDSEQTDRFSYKGRIGRDGRFSLSNVDGDITITGGSGDEVTIEALKRTRGDQRDLSEANIDVDARAGHIDVRTTYPSRRNIRVSVSYTVTVPTSAGVDVRSVSGDVKVTGVQGSVRAESVSGDVTTSGTPRLEVAKSVSGDVDLADAGAEAELRASSVSGSVRARGFKARSLDASTVSGDVVLTDVACDRLGVRSISGNAEYSGTLPRNGRYDFNSHSGDVRLTLSESTGFELTANTFSGSMRSDLPLTIGGDTGSRGRQSFVSSRSMRATFGDGSAVLTIRTFSGDIIISKR